MAETYKELRELPDDELMKRYSEAVAHRDTPVIHYLYVLNWRYQKSQTNQIKWMTVVITFATIANLAFFICDVLT